MPQGREELSSVAYNWQCSVRRGSLSKLCGVPRVSSSLEPERERICGREQGGEKKKPRKEKQRVPNNNEYWRGELAQGLTHMRLTFADLELPASWRIPWGWVL